MKNTKKHYRNQRGAVALTFALLLVLLLGFMGLAFDFGHLLVVKTELQTAMDSCALAAAQELDGQTDSITRARNAGIAAGNVNRVNLQSASWSDQPKITAGDIIFRDTNHALTSDPATARYVRCKHVQANTSTPLLHMLSLQSTSPAYAAKMDVLASAEATTTPSQSTCPLPLALVAKNSTKPNYGFTRGEWVTLLINQASTPGGQIGWANLTGSNGAKTLAEQLKGYCGTRVDDPVINGASGVVASVGEYWNNRFGIYKGKLSDITPDYIKQNQPDFTGYGFTSTNWNAKDINGKTCCAYDNNAYVKDTIHKSFLYHRQAFSTCVGSPSSSTDVQNDCGKPMGYTKLVTGQAAAVSGGLNGALFLYGTNRRIMPVPIVGSTLDKSTDKIVDFACMLMLQPMPDSADKTQQVSLEYLGNASAPSSPCRASGLPGGTAGPLVPVLVR